MNDKYFYFGLGWGLSFLVAILIYSLLSEPLEAKERAQILAEAQGMEKTFVDELIKKMDSQKINAGNFNKSLIRIRQIKKEIEKGDK